MEYPKNIASYFQGGSPFDVLECLNIKNPRILIVVLIKFQCLFQFMFINKNLRLNNSKTKTAMNLKI